MTKIMYKYAFKGYKLRKLRRKLRNIKIIKEFIKIINI